MPDNPTTPEVEAETLEAAEIMQTGWHVSTAKGTFLGCYQTEADARAFAEGHLEPQKIKYTVTEVR
jgi:hypothetical protein